MAKIIDLSVIQQEPLIFKVPNGDEFIVPGEVSTGFVMKMNKMYEDMHKEDIDDMDKLKMMKQIVIEILKLDKNNEITVNMKYIDENLDDIRYLQAIIEAMSKHITEIQSDENLNSPKSDK